MSLENLSEEKYINPNDVDKKLSSDVLGSILPIQPKKQGSNGVMLFIFLFTGALYLIAKK